MLQTIRRHTSPARPVELTLMAFPFKVPNPAKVGFRTLPDLAEFTALHRLGKLCVAVRGVYEPGLHINLILDGTSLAPIVDVGTDEVAAYARYLTGLIRDAGVSDQVSLFDFDALLHHGDRAASVALPRLRRAAREWWLETRGSPLWQQAFHRMLGMINLRDLPVPEIEHLLAAAREGSLSPGTRTSSDASVFR
ncbi:MAG: L-tyrosine/L-tryptophan isonitrile synthase family protein [Chloroflexota bacterium]